MTDLEFRARERHPYFYVGAVFGVVFVATGIAAVVANVASFGNDIVALFAFGFGAAILVSAAFAVCGRLRVQTHDDGWCTVTWTLGSWARSKRFPLADVRSVQRYSPPPFAVMWPSIAGTQLRVDVKHESRPIDIGGGFMLDDASLAAIESVLRAPR
jgi:hypothetical protein